MNQITTRTKKIKKELNSLLINSDQDLSNFYTLVSRELELIDQIVETNPKVNWQYISEEMRELFNKDNSLTDIQVNFSLRPATQRRTGIITIKQY